MGAIASQITSLTIVYSSVYSGADQRKYHSSSSLDFVWGIHWWPVYSPHKGQVKRKMFPFDDVIMHEFIFLINGVHIASANILAGFCVVLSTVIRHHQDVMASGRFLHYLPETTIE